jgi:hypothetical protein
MLEGKLSQITSIGQGMMYIITGFWPLFSRKTFEKVTGPKHDFWLVNTVGVIIGSIGLILVSAGFHRRITPEIRGLGVASAAGLTGIDVFYVSKNRISPIYLLDAVVESCLIIGWVSSWLASRKSGGYSIGSR